MHRLHIVTFTEKWREIDFWGESVIKGKFDDTYRLLQHYYSDRRLLDSIDPRAMSKRPNYRVC